MYVVIKSINKAGIDNRESTIAIRVKYELPSGYRSSQTTDQPDIAKIRDETPTNFKGVKCFRKLFILSYYICCQ